jgi:SAM-dependent methyltransferase
MRYNEDLIEGLNDLIKWIDNPSDWTLVEVGSWTGESTRAFAKSFGKVISVDPHHGFDLVREYFTRECSDFPNIEHIQKHSIPASKQFEFQSVDVVYIDADHHYEAVKKDILHWLPKVKNGGVLCGHDYDLEAPQSWPRYGVRIAVNEIFGQPHATFRDDSWAIRINSQKLPSAIPVI